MSGKSLEKYLRELRKSFNYSQEYVASQLNITRQTYSHYETGRITPPIDSLYNLSKIYKVPLNSFLELSIDHPRNEECPIAESSGSKSECDDINEFLKHISIPENDKKFKLLKRQEKLILYYYQQLDDRDQEDILTFMKLKYHNRKRGSQKDITQAERSVAKEAKTPPQAAGHQI
ncbi:MAG: helix-turn-helix domain-containing protein [Blautia sp.]|nr:helix-turn-helix domain-containing protein [Blautia sp.]MCM1201818.1 helix-turn-helix domain-containing protein [Bacteroides fragilis]